ncbi:sugar transferase [Robbsia andropogonis]|uniref:sugar transferase n=1 Tax=Robbsia andropogonis TaxID=28092 RepID=UPI00209EE124|nr:sugar transferase [Robbsia andropogonis]MCP1120792.1 sugar transferase [Robbsia andropogonis]MCP1130533.1 sugar transferase [Robbsia andropogonis]
MTCGNFKKCIFKKLYYTKDVIFVLTTALSGYMSNSIILKNISTITMPAVQFLILFSVLPALFIFEYFRLHLYCRNESIITLRTQSLFVWSAIWSVSVSLVYILQLNDNSLREWALIWLAFVSLLLVLSKFTIQHAFQQFCFSSEHKKHVFIIGDERFGQSLHLQAEKILQYRYRIIGCYNRQATSTTLQISNIDSTIPLMNQITTIRPFLVENHVDEVWLMLTLEAYAEIQAILAQLQTVPVKIRWLLDPCALDLISRQRSEVLGYQSIEMNQTPAPGVQGYLKKIFDRSIASFLLILTLPIFILLALTIYLTSPGPVFYGHTRIGANGKKFQVYKFRSMITNSQEILEKILSTNPIARAEWEADHKLRNDPRITKIGKLLRATSLDELPQLLNVIRGEMSLVGPRPIVEAEIIKYGKAIYYYYAARPGITGLWQVSGRNDVTYTSRVRLDTEYVMTWSLMRDLTILVKTISVVFGRKGAY